MSINNLSSSSSSNKNDLKNLSYDQLQKKLQDARLKDDIISIADEISIRENLWNNSVIDQIKKSKNKLTRIELKNLLSAHIQEYVRNKWLKNIQSNNIAQENKIKDLMKQLDDSKKALEERDMEDEKMIKIVNPVELTRRRRLKSIMKKFNEYKKTDIKKAFAYFITKTSFWKWGKVSTWLKQAWLFMKNLSLFSTMGEKQILKMKERIKEAIKDLKEDTDDTPTVKRLKTNIKKEVAETANKYFDQITKPLQEKIAA